MTAKRKGLARLFVVGAFVALAFTGAIAIALNGHATSNEGLLPPLPEQAASRQDQHQTVQPGREQAEHSHPEQENELGAPPAPGTASLAGPAASVVQRFAQDWANRDVLLTPPIKREMVGLSAGAWANAVFKQARLTLPAIEGVRAEGDMVMMKLTSVAPGSKTALVVTEERVGLPDGGLTPPRYEIYLARLDRVTPRGYAITGWEPQQ